MVAVPAVVILDAAAQEPHHYSNTAKKERYDYKLHAHLHAPRARAT
mgnify:CR=1 FL=1